MTVQPEAVATRQQNEKALEECRATVRQARERIGKIAQLRKATSGRFEAHTVAQAA